MGVIVASFALFFGFAIGASAIDGAWKSDCEKIGAHASGEQVYICSKKK